MRTKGSPAELERQRLRAYELLKNGHSQAEVARMLGVTECAVSRWRKQSIHGPEGLKARPHPGPEPRLSSTDCQKLEQFLLQGALAFGWSNNLWTCSRVTEVIRRTFRVSYHHDHVRKILTDRLGWSSQKPEIRARERNEEAIASWRQTEYANIKKKPKKRARPSSTSTNQDLC